jgi:hypothetical protein
MQQALWILRKDFRRCWGLIVLVVTMEILADWVSSSAWAAQAQFFITLPKTLAHWFLIVSLIQQEALPGDRQYWLTRPIGWKRLLLAKALFILLFIHLPGFLVDAASLHARGQSIVHYLPSLLACQFFLLANVVLPTAAIAAVTATLAQFVWCSLAFSIGYSLILLSLSNRVASGIDWGGVEWFRSTVTAALVVAGTTAILLMQYVRRNTLVSRCILAAGIPTMAFCLWMPGWHAAFALQARIGPHNADTSAIRMSFDPPRILSPRLGL